MADVVSVRLDPGVAAQLRDIANERGTTVSALLREGAVMAANEPNTMTITWLGEPTVVTGNTAIFTMDSDPGQLIERALTAFHEDDERHWQVQAYLFNLLAHKAQTQVDQIRNAAAIARGGVAQNRHKEGQE